jgi:hypothetical protein
MVQLLGSSVTYRIAIGPRQGRKVFTLQTLPACAQLTNDRPAYCVVRIWRPVSKPCLLAT